MDEVLAAKSVMQQSLFDEADETPSLRGPIVAAVAIAAFALVVALVALGVVLLR
jgi:hypothetical protein